MLSKPMTCHKLERWEAVDQLQTHLQQVVLRILFQQLVTAQQSRFIGVGIQRICRVLVSVK